MKGPYPVFGSNGIVGWHNESLVKGPFIIVGRKGSAGAITYSEQDGFPIDTTFYVSIKDDKILNLKFLYFQLFNLNLDKVNVQSGVPGLNRNDAYLKQIALPSIVVQQEIVAQIEKEQQLVDANKQLIQIYEQKIKSKIAEVWEPNYPLPTQMLVPSPLMGEGQGEGAKLIPIVGVSQTIVSTYFMKVNVYFVESKCREGKFLTKLLYPFLSRLTISSSSFAYSREKTPS